jgi:hypothetical protein
MIALPLLLVDLSSEKVSILENRKLANPPTLADLKKRPGKFKGDFDSWLQDSTGFREQFVSLYNNTIGKKTLFNGVSYILGIFTCIIGEQGHHYFANIKGSMIPKFQGKQYLSDKQLQNMTVKLEELKKYLNNKDIPLIVMFNTDKESIYPEFYPKSIKRGSKPIQLDLITNYLRDNTSVDVFNIKQALLKQKNNYLLYPVSGGIGNIVDDLSHYTEIASFFAYHELMEHINTYFPSIIPLELADVDISNGQKGVQNVSLKKNTYRYLGPSFFDNVSFIDDPLWGVSFNYAYENSEPDLPVILLLSTSYSSGTRAGKFIAQTFGRTIMTHFKNMEYIEEYIDRFKPDIVVLESTEYQLKEFADSVARIPKL